MFRLWNQLTKPRVTVLVLATVLPGMYLGTNGYPSLWEISITLLGTYLMSSASFILNQYIERERDAVMYRTKQRPIPAGEISPSFALFLGIFVAILAFGILTYYINLLTAVCALSALLLYVFLYTIWLKPRTEQNIVIGGISGCIGPLIGYAAMANTLPVPSWVLFLMIFLWTPAHFWALAIFLKDDYAYAGIPMMPVVSGIQKTVNQIFLYAIAYSLSVIGFYFADERMGYLFLISAMILTVLILTFAYRLKLSGDKLLAKRFFFFSILHLFLVSLVIVIDSKI
ncbi:heme o synthase [Leptospira sp. 2 VSF19]|uniref:Protoheme IX farnesyltransferase n=1 Tax=Leptospira soteropolitanensis TaxID=2950025 RepID=A0AAW5VPJ6_9LEPT|nr:heme o synthase [Leptospira soteropolitanensis]MCW7493470.1 heme o synthase [Leptospira soteropolitanensis]MCW7500998.1 heme o synthase [Leptospira soteropolitanensis]MCW7523322.1 heme o synthase [Leptospira soteropolitanensis]MCW7527183.1 heme o synthase [Leptospira soteropolitanensis]MCW7531040.1 heme o synthase [Leptospira soteropolitanensis]